MASLIFWGDLRDWASDASSSSKIISLTDVDVVAANVRAADVGSLLLVKDNVITQAPEAFDSIAKGAKLPIALIYEDLSSSAITQLIHNSQINHVIPSRSENPQAVLERLKSTAALNKLAFQPAELTDRRDIEIVHSNQFDCVFAEISSYVKTLKCFPGFEGIAVTAASELLTNAFYNAKRDPKSGAPLVTDRRIKFKLDHNETVTVTFGRETQYMWVIVRDPFGSLDRPTLVKALHRAAVEKAPRLDSPGGAGLGLLMLFNWATELCFFLDYGKSTAVACRFKLTNRNRIFESEPSALHIFI